MNKHQLLAQDLVARTRKPILFTETNGTVLYANQAALQWLEVELKELIGQPLDQVCICEETKSQMVRLREELMNEGSDRLECSIPDAHQNGSANLCASTAMASSSDEQYGITYLIEFDSRDQKLDKIILDNLMKNCDDMIYFKDLKSRFIRYSDSAVRQYRAPSAEYVYGKSDFDFFAAEDAARFYECEQEIIRTGEPWLCKTEKVSGKAVWVITSKMPLLDEEGRTVGTFGISKDVTAQKEFEEELKLANQKLVVTSRQAGMAEIATNVIHNVGNVLNSVNVSVSQVNEINRGLKIKNLSKVAKIISENADVENFLIEDEKGKRIPEYLTMIAEELQRDQQKIQEELNTTRRHLSHIKTIVAMQQEYATSSTVVESTDLSQLLNDAVQISSSSLARHNIELVKDYDDSIMALIDQHQVLQILVNLIRNAKHACQATERQGQQIVLRVRKSEDTIEISVSDNGVGIGPENLRKLFHHGFTTKPRGHGFGLHSGANSARQMGGELQGFSEGLGKGAKFVLTLPNHPSHPSQTTAEKPQEESSEPSSVANVRHC